MSAIGSSSASSVNGGFALGQGQGSASSGLLGPNVQGGGFGVGVGK